MLDRLMQPPFWFSLRALFRWKCFLLGCFGAKLGRNVHVYPSAMIYFFAAASPLVEARLSERGGHVEGRETVADCH